jgi:TonB family protein
MSSLWPPALASLDDSLALPCETLGRLQAAKAVDVEEVIKQLALAAESAGNLRSLVSSELPEAAWQNREELDALLAEIQKISDARTGLLALAAELERGRIVHRRAVRVTQLNQLREQAINELRCQAGSGGAPKILPGPAANEWIEWACGLKEPEDAESLRTLRNRFAFLDNFVADLEPGMWIPDTVPEASLPNGDELKNLIEEIREQLRSRLLALATELERGSIVHHRALRVNQLNALREQAIIELRLQAGSGGAPQTLPGPRADQWIEWACGLKEPEDAESLQTLRDGFANLDDFVANLEPDMWKTGGSPPSGVLPEPEEPADKAHQEQSRLETTGLGEPMVSSGPALINLKAATSSEGGDEPQYTHSLDEPSQSALESDTLTSNYVTPPQTAEEGQPVPAQKRALLAITMGTVNELVGRFKHPVEPPLAADNVPETDATPVISPDIRTGVEGTHGRKWRMLLAIAAVLMLAALGAILWRSHRNHNGPAKAIENQIPDPTLRNPQNNGYEQSGMSTDSQTRTSSPTTLQTEIQSKPLSAASPATEAGKLEEGGSPPPVLTIPNDIANGKKEKSSRKGATEAPDAVPPALSFAVPNSVTNVASDIPVAQPKLAAQPVRVSSGGVQGLVIHQVAPLYPAQARLDRVQGTVVLQAVIGKDGSVLNVHALSGNPILIRAAVDAVKQWRFKPYTLNGEPVESETQVNVNFTL